MLKTLLLLLAPCAVAAQTVRVSGAIVDERQIPLQGALVRLVGDLAQTTGTDGRFQFDSVVPGRYLVNVTAAGHRMQSIDLAITRDTTITVVMARLIVTLDTMIVRAGPVTIQAAVVDSATGDFLPQAQAILYPHNRRVGAMSGVFAFKNVPPGPVTIVVEALEHLPTQIDLNPRGDTAIVVRLGIDSIALRMIAIQVKRLETRQRAIPIAATVLNRDLVIQERAPTILDLVTRRMYGDPVSVRQAGGSAAEGCYFLDDAKVAPDVLEGVLPEVVERVEIYKEPGGPAPSMRGRPTGRTAPQNRGGIRMVRVYTKRYVASLPRFDVLPKATYIQGVRTSCA
jgi:hypothetical protein